VNKFQLRKKIFKIRSKFARKKITVNSEIIIKLIEQKSRNKRVGLYYPFGDELSTLELMDRLTKKNFIISLPVISNKFEMSFYRWSPNEPLTINRYGILEPIKGKKITPSTLIIPMLAFDSDLNRLGYGGGFYDRFIKKIERQSNCVKIGLALSCQKINKVPFDKYDKKMDFIITEKRIYK
tara:strand:- start:30 stop:572 length:543 start_codon:yes stop_codon:yes gene_type:complete